MARLQAARNNPGDAAEYLLAFQQGGDPDDEDAAYLGACLWAEVLQLIRLFLQPKK